MLRDEAVARILRTCSEAVPLPLSALSVALDLTGERGGTLARWDGTGQSSVSLMAIH